MKKRVKPKSMEVVAAVIRHKKKFLIAKRGLSQSFPSKWEFPGGKVEKDESFQDALIREIKEELSVEISVLEKISSESVEDNKMTININYFYAEIHSGIIELTEHSDFRWIDKSDFKSYDFIIGDERILPLIF